MNFKPLLLAASIIAVQPASAQQPDAKAIMEGARMSASLAKLDKGLAGAIRKGGAKTDLMLFLMGKDIQFQFSQNKEPWKIFHLRMADGSYNLYEIVNGKSADFPDKKLTEPIAGTDLTYEDLALRFLYWPEPKFEGMEEVAGQGCYKIRIDKPKGVAGRYEVVYVWVHAKFGAFMRIRGHDKSGGLVKEFQVDDVMQVSKEVWTLRKMQVSSHDPATGKRQSITDVTFDTPNIKAAPKGLR